MKSILTILLLFPLSAFADYGIFVTLSSGTSLNVETGAAASSGQKVGLVQLVQSATQKSDGSNP